MPRDGLWHLDAMMPPAQAARAASVSRQLVRDWYLRGRLYRDPLTGLVRLGDVLDLEAETRNCAHIGHFQRKPRKLIAA